MVLFNYETDFELSNEVLYEQWVDAIITSEDKEPGEINYIFCDDAYLHQINQEYLQHDTYTDIISFDYSLGQLISGDIFISVERVRENAQEYEVSFSEELLRVMSHGILHYCGYTDDTSEAKDKMRFKENEKIALFHVEQ